MSGDGIDGGPVWWTDPYTAWAAKKKADKAKGIEPKKEAKKGIDFSGLAQLMTMGAGAPMLGDLKKTNFNKPEAEGGAALQFELEANNLTDENGESKQVRML